MSFTISIDDANELLQGMREAAAEMKLLRARRDSMLASITAAKSKELKPDKRNDVSGYDFMAEVAAEVADIEADMKRLEQIIMEDRKQVQKIIPHLEQDQRMIVTLYYLSPVKDAEGNLRTWKEVETMMHLSHTAIMQRRRELFDKVNKVIEMIQ